MRVAEASVERPAGVGSVQNLPTAHKATRYLP